MSVDKTEEKTKDEVNLSKGTSTSSTLHSLSHTPKIDQDSDLGRNEGEFESNLKIPITGSLERTDAAEHGAQGGELFLQFLIIRLIHIQKVLNIRGYSAQFRVASQTYIT